MNKKQFLALLEPLQPRLFGFAYRMLHDGEGAKDAMQELIYKLWKKRKELQTNKNISAYCFQAMHNICIDELRKKGRFTEFSDDAEKVIEKLEWGMQNAERRMENAELITRIRKFVGQLPEKQKAIIELHDFQEFNHKEIAEILDMEVNAVRVNLSRARARIVAQFKKEEIYG